ncbi:hypothetical protein LY76DRAFT_364696 [Colletotrichum caudatum]|nr:hypothetical protein LY76DRAFT_364696 [Colletotrichum caudatum]
MGGRGRARCADIGRPQSHRPKMTRQCEGHERQERCIMYPCIDGSGLLLTDRQIDRQTDRQTDRQDSNQSVEEETDRVEGRLATGWGCVVGAGDGRRFVRRTSPRTLPKRDEPRDRSDTDTPQARTHAPSFFERGGSRTRPNQWCEVISVWRWQNKKRIGRFEMRLLVSGDGLFSDGIGIHFFILFFGG